LHAAFVACQGLVRDSRKVTALQQELDPVPLRLLNLAAVIKLTADPALRRGTEA
jgi:hypothetical protein